MERKLYKLTDGNKKKITVNPEDIDNLVSEYSKSLKSSKKKGLMVLDYKLKLMAKTEDYILGCWQGKLDKSSGLEYSEERNDNFYNLGYYRGYTEKTSGYLADAINSNSNFSHLK